MHYEYCMSATTTSTYRVQHNEVRFIPLYLSSLSSLVSTDFASFAETHSKFLVYKEEELNMEVSHLVKSPWNQQKDVSSNHAQNKPYFQSKFQQLL